MKKNNINKHEVICAFYDSTDETKTEHHDFMNILVKHRWRLRPLYFKNNYIQENYLKWTPPLVPHTYSLFCLYCFDYPLVLVLISY